MTSFMLRALALITMICDHLGYNLLSRYSWLRIIGRLAFPIYCFLLVQGFRHTRSVKKYGLRLAAFALISEVPYNMLFRRGTQFMGIKYVATHNVFFSLLLALLALAACKAFLPKRPIWAVLCVAAACGLSMRLETDYSFFGIALALAFYAAGENPLKITLGFAAALGLYTLYRLHLHTSTSWVITQLYCLFSLIPILLYNGKPGYRGGKYLFYLLYPAHILVLVYWRQISVFFGQIG